MGRHPRRHRRRDLAAQPGVVSVPGRLGDRLCARPGGRPGRALGVRPHVRDLAGDGGFFFILAAIILLADPRRPGAWPDQVGRAGHRGIAGSDRPYLEEYLNQPQQKPDGKGAESHRHATQAIKWAGGMAGQLVQGGIAVFNILSLIFITPVVTFYLLRDWDRIVATHGYVAAARPRADDPQAAAGDRQPLGRLLRGQALVCLLLGVFYAIGLSLVGLNYGLIIGLVTGLLSFVPYIGMLMGAGRPRPGLLPVRRFVDGCGGGRRFHARPDSRG